MKKRVLIGYLIILLVCESTVIAFGQYKFKIQNEAKTRDIRKLLDATGSAKIGMQLLGQTIRTYRASMPQVPSAFWDEIMNEVKAEDLIETAVPIYDKYLSHDDIRELIKFYESPAGKKFVSVQPQIAQELGVASEKWGKELNEKIMKKLQEQGKKESSK